jgi:hypothetical protein
VAANRGWTTWTREQATAVLDEAHRSGHGGVVGDLGMGFWYWSGWHETTGCFLRTHVYAVGAEQVPVNERRILDAGGWVLRAPQDAD